MKVLSTSVPIFTSHIEAAIERYEALMRETVRQRFQVPEQGIEIAILGSLTIIAAPEHYIGALRNLRATFIVDSLAEYAAHFALDGRNDASGSKPDAIRHNLIVRDVEGVVFEFVEPHSKE